MVMVLHERYDGRRRIIVNLVRQDIAIIILHTTVQVDNYWHNITQTGRAVQTIYESTFESRNTSIPVHLHIVSTYAV